jgi:hypothetical protein
MCKGQKERDDIHVSENLRMEIGEVYTAFQRIEYRIILTKMISLNDKWGMSNATMVDDINDLNYCVRNSRFYLFRMSTMMQEVSQIYLKNTYLHYDFI